MGSFFCKTGIFHLRVQLRYSSFKWFCVRGKNRDTHCSPLFSYSAMFIGSETFWWRWFTLWSGAHVHTCRDVESAPLCGRLKRWFTFTPSGYRETGSTQWPQTRLISSLRRANQRCFFFILLLLSVHQYWISPDWDKHSRPLFFFSCFPLMLGVSDARNRRSDSILRTSKRTSGIYKRACFSGSQKSSLLSSCGNPTKIKTHGGNLVEVPSNLQALLYRWNASWDVVCI